MTDREAFRLGFLQGCLDLGLDPAAAAEKAAAAVRDVRAAKAAGLTDLLTAPLDAAKSLGSTALSWGVPAALAAPPVLGLAAGYGARRLTDVDDSDVDEIKNQELRDELRRQTAILRQSRLAQAVRSRALAGTRGVRA